MCVYSMCGDMFQDRWKPYTIPYRPFIPEIPLKPYPYPPAAPDDTVEPPWIVPTAPPNPPMLPTVKPLTDEEIIKIREDIKTLEELLKRAKKYDEENGEPDCELDKKKKWLQKVADAAGVKINFP